MQLESYFDFADPPEIRVKGTRIGIQTVLEDYFEGASPEEIAVRYRSLDLEKVYATLLYYFSHRVEIEQYLATWRSETEQMWLQYQRNPSPATQRLSILKEQRAHPYAETTVDESDSLPA